MRTSGSLYRPPKTPTGSPNPFVRRTLNGKTLEDCEHTRYVRDEENEIYALQLTYAVLEDIGTYAFTASNDAGDAKGDCKLHVHSKSSYVMKGPNCYIELPKS